MTALVDIEDLPLNGEPLYVLTCPEGGLELRETEPPGEVILWVYASVAKLVASCGDGQPYVLASVGELTEFAAALEVPVWIVLDAWHPEGARYAEVEVDEMEPIDPFVPDDSDTSLVWIPARPGSPGERVAVAELYSAVPGEPLLLVYDSLEILRENCGPHQAACAVPAERIDAVARQTGAHGVAFNAILAEHIQHTGPVQDWDRESREWYLK